MTETQIITSLVQSLTTSGPVAALLLIAVWWLTKGNRELLTELHTERKDRLDDMENQLARLQTRSDACEEDRLHLHRQLAELQRLAACSPSIDKPQRA